MNQKEARSK